MNKIILGHFLQTLRYPSIDKKKIDSLVMTLPRRKRSSLSSLAKNVLSKSFKSYLQVRRCAMILNCAGLIEDLSH